ncbi:hypothetical protein SAMN05428970_3155 [Agromyces sp. CF514]|uniref:DUF4190 domain-containing protein n=1 Tax=Agromyces sp. CF514 TaxID=1881031 RepID=UPI0008E59812|nr:DUF4190 domain-containing protein [Agromyces sp. CF514]SFR85311.1 hypothetical protein SAMN05428970_3155 [Agromyces sp. CF514]
MTDLPAEPPRPGPVPDASPEASGTEPARPPIDESALRAAAPSTDGVTLPMAVAPRQWDMPLDTGELRTVPTGQLLIVHRPEAFAEASEEVEEEETQRRVYSWVGAVLGVIGAAASLFVGWMLPLSIVAIIFGVLGLRREETGRTLAFVAIGTGVGGLVFSAVWIGYYAIVFGTLQI